MKYVYARRGDGLGTRLLVIMQAKILADYLGYELRIVWPSIGAPFYKSDDLLSQVGLEDVLASSYFFATEAGPSGLMLDAEAEKEIDAVEVTSISPDILVDKQRLDDLLQDKSGLIYSMPHQVLSDEQLGVSVSQCMKKLWRELNWSQSFRRSTEAFNASADLRTAISIHARRGDIVTMLRDADIKYLHEPGMEQFLQRFVATQSFIDAIEAQSTERGSLVVCGEDEDVALAISNKFVRRRVISTRQLAGSETKKAFLDFYFLAQSKMVIAPFHSYFSGCAAIVGVCQLRSLQLNVPDTMKEVFRMIDDSSRTDKAAVKFLVCAIYSRMLSNNTPFRVTIEHTQN